MTLDKQMEDFVIWCRTHACPGFLKYCSEIYYDEYSGTTVEEELLNYSSEMRDAAKLNDKNYFNEVKTRYYDIFSDYSRRKCIKDYDKILCDLSKDPTVSVEEAGKLAVERAWSYPHMRYWLPIYALLKDGKGKEVALVARKEHAPKSKNYVTISEVSELVGTGLDPWKYVEQRRAA